MPDDSPCGCTRRNATSRSPADCRIGLLAAYVCTFLERARGSEIEERRSHQILAAITDNDAAGDIGGKRRGEEYCDLADVIDLAHEAMAAHTPGARLEVIESCGHLSTIEQPEVVNRVLRNWLRETDADCRAH